MKKENRKSRNIKIHEKYKKNYLKIVEKNNKSKERKNFINVETKITSNNNKKQIIRTKVK